MTRIIAGRAGGRRLRTPTSGTRPTTDRVREALFARLDALIRAEDQSWQDLVVVDLCAGSGALGLEAWSRGARAVTCVERDRSTCRVIEANRDQLDAHDVSVVCADIETWIPTDQFDCCFIDAPYAWSSQRISDVLDRLVTQGALTEHAIVVAERPRGESSPLPAAIRCDAERLYGDTVLWYGRLDVERG
jgi:16S rRNA (guanine966-N2)-methyltransferase